MPLFVFFISLLIVVQHVSGNHVPIIRSWRLCDVIASCWYVPWLQEVCPSDALSANRSLIQIVSYISCALKYVKQTHSINWVISTPHSGRRVAYCDYIYVSAYQQCCHRNNSILDDSWMKNSNEYCNQPVQYSFVFHNTTRTCHLKEWNSIVKWWNISKSPYCFTLVWTWNATTQYQKHRSFLLLPRWGRTEPKMEVGQQGRYLKRMKCPYITFCFGNDFYYEPVVGYVIP